MADAKLTYGTPRVVLELSMDEAAALEAVLLRADATASNVSACDALDSISTIWTGLNRLKEEDRGSGRHWPTDVESFRQRPTFLID